MNKNPNKKAGSWGALKTKPQNLVPFGKGGTTKQTDMKKQLTKKQAGGGTPKSKSQGTVDTMYRSKKVDTSNALTSGVYRSGKKFNAADAEKMQQDWNKKERATTNPANKPKGSALTPLKKGGSIKKKK